MTPSDSQLVNRCEVGGSFQFFHRTTRQQHMKKTKQQRKRRYTFHFLKFTFPLSLNRLHPKQSSLVVHVVRPTERPPPEFPDSRSNPRSYPLKARYAGLLSGSGSPSLAGFSRQTGLVQAQSVMDKFVLLTCLNHSSSVWTDIEC